MLEKRLRDSEAEKETLAAQLTVQPQAGKTSPGQERERERPSQADIVNEVSFFASTAAGDRPYLGSTSGVLFAHLVLPEADSEEESRDTEGGPQPTLPTQPEAWSRDNNLSSNSDLHAEAVTSKSTSSIEGLPSERRARRLVAAYLGHDHLRYPFLEPAFVHSVAGKIYTGRASGVDRVVSAFEWFTFDMVLGIAKLHESNRSDWHQQTQPSSAVTHQFKAMFHIKEVLRSGGLQSLQAILLLIQYRTSSSVQDTSASLWHLVGIAARMVYELGLHREASYRNINHSMPQMSPARQQQMHQQQTIGRLCFWCVFALDR
jgi:hypothetical protein